MRHQLFRVTEMAVVLLVYGCTPATAQVTFQKFPLRDAFINDMSADGSVVVGNYIDISRKGQAFRWTAAGGEENMGGNMDEVAISRDGKTIVGRAADSNGIQNAAIWQSGKNWRLLGGVPGGIPDGRSEISAAYGVSANGSVIVGAATIKNGIDYHGFRWEASKGVVDLGALQGDSSWARHVSADGNVIVGYDMVAKGGYSPVPGGRIGAIFWGGLESKLHGLGYAGEVRGTNAVGSILVGQFHPLGGTVLPDGTFRRYAGGTTYLYTSWDGKFEDLGAVVRSELPEIAAYNEYISLPHRVSDNGEVVVGRSGSFALVASVWTRATGMVRVADYLNAHGVTDHRGWQLTFTTYVSPDGKKIAGTGLDPQLVAYSWIVTLP